MISRLLFLFVCFHFFNLCHSQVAITLFNRSSDRIDSFVIHCKKPISTGPIGPNESKVVFVSTDNANFHSFVPFSFSIHSPVLKIEQQWQKTGFTDSLYFFDHGLSKSDQLPRRPGEFWLYVGNNNSSPVDSVFTAGSAIEAVRETTPRSFELKLNHKAIEKEKYIFFQLGGKTLRFDINHSDFNNWNKVSDALYIYDDTVRTDWQKNIKPLEFVVEFEWDENQKTENVLFKSPQPVKTYVEKEGRLIRAAFEYKKLAEADRLELQVGRKKHTVTLSPADFENTTYLLLRKQGKKLQRH